MKKHISIIIAIIVLIFLSYSDCLAEVGVTKNEIRIGSIMDISGPAAFLGKGLYEGAKLYFTYLNDTGGIHGRKIKYYVEDDGYQSPRAVQACRKLVARDKIFSLFLVVGSVQINAMYPFLEHKGIPILLPGTQTRDIVIPPRKYLFLSFATFTTQAKIAVEFIVDNLKIKKPKIACIYQDDSPGHDWKRGVRIGTSHNGLDFLDLSYKRGTVDFSSQIAKCKEAGITHILMFTLVREPALIMKEAQRVQYKAVYITSTISASNKVVKLVGDTVNSTNGFYATSLINDPLTSKNSAIKKYKKIMAKYKMCSIDNFPNVIGYQSAMLLCEAIKRAGKNLTREKLIKAMESFKNYDTGIIPPVTFGPNKRAGSNAVKIYKVKDGLWKAVSKWRFSKIKEE